MSRKCQALYFTTGERCNRLAMFGSDFCTMHEHAVARREGSHLFDDVEKQREPFEEEGQRYEQVYTKETVEIVEKQELTVVLSNGQRWGLDDFREYWVPVVKEDEADV